MRKMTWWEILFVGILTLALSLAYLSCGGGDDGSGDDDDDDSSKADDDDDDSSKADDDDTDDASSFDGECYSHSDCSESTEVCVNQKCEYMFGRKYTLTINTIEVAERKDDGDTWDTGAGAPDLFVVVYVDGVEIGRTTTVDDRYSATFNESFTIDLFSDSIITLEIVDEDLASDDSGSIDIYGQDLQYIIKQGDANYAGGSLLEFTFTIEVKL
ncbi:MAG: hypothetical protein Kow0090_05830 [Myxococcota bacterium]